MSLRLRQASHCLALLLLPALAPGFSRAVPRPRATPGPEAQVQPPRPTRALSEPYLRVVGAPPLRFAVESPPPDLVTRPPASGTPPEATDPAEMESALPPLSLPVSSVPLATESADVQPSTVAVENPAARAASGENRSATPSATAPVERGPAPILPDDLRPAVRPEDFLPFFQLPGTSGGPANATVIVPVVPQAPAPATLPPSSATYRQTP